MDEYGTESAGVGAAPSVARLLLELRSRTNTDVKTVGKTLQVRPKGGSGIAVHIHPGGVDVAVAQDRANEVALSMPGAYVRDPDDPDCFVSVQADLIDENYDALLDAAVEAVDMRAAAPPAPVRKTRAAAAPKTPAVKAVKAAKASTAKAKPPVRPDPPRCSKCRQYELLASGECPSGYC